MHITAVQLTITIEILKMRYLYSYVHSLLYHTITQITEYMQLTFAERCNGVGTRFIVHLTQLMCTALELRLMLE